MIILEIIENCHEKNVSLHRGVDLLAFALMLQRENMGLGKKIKLTTNPRKIKITRSALAN